MVFKWTKACSDKVKEYRNDTTSTWKTLPVSEFVKLLHDRL